MGAIRAVLLVMVAGAIPWSRLNAGTPELSEYQVKAAYFYNFAKFVEWPKDSFSTATEPIRLCVLRDHLFQEELLQVVQGKILAGRAVEVLYIDAPEQARTCNALFVNAFQGRQIRRLMQALHGTSVLTVGETEEFLSEGGAIAFVVEGERVQFQISRKAASEARLFISSKMLSLAKRVVD
jgi:hypothetical protein